MRNKIMYLLAMLAIALGSGCFDFNALSSGALDGGEPDGMSADGGGPAEGDFATAADMATAEAVDLAMLDITQAVDAIPAVDMAELPDAPPPDMNPCVGTLANVGQGDFTVRFRLTTKAVAQSTVLWQRSECSAIKDFWDIYTAPNTGKMIVEVGQGNVGFATLNTSIVVNDGLPHIVMVQRKAGVLSALTDGKPSGAVAAAQSLGALPPLGVANGHPCDGLAGIVALVGAVDQVCISVP